MSGFVASAAATLASCGIEGGDPGCVMGYYDGADVPVYDHLAEEFAVCDRWFASVAGATLPNRLYALCGMAAGSRDDRPSYVPPLYHQPSFVRHLDAHGVSWRWYSFDPGTLRLADVYYRLGHHQRFGYFSKTGLPWKTVFDITCNPEVPVSLKTPRLGRCGRCRGSTRRSLTSTRSASRSTTTTPWPTSKTARTWCWPSTTRWPQAPNGIVRCWSSSTTKTAASTITSRRRKPRMTSPTCSAATACGCQRSSSRHGSSHAPSRTPCSINLGHQNDSVALLPPNPAAGRAKAGQAGPGPAIPSLRVAHANHLGGLLTRSTPRPAPSRDALVQQAAAGPPNRNQPAPAQAPRRRRPAAQRLAEKHSCRNVQTEKGWAPIERAIDSPRVGACRAGRTGWLTVIAGTGSARVPGR